LRIDVFVGGIIIENFSGKFTGYGIELNKVENTEFEQRYTAMLKLKKAKIIERIVYIVFTEASLYLLPI